MERRPPRASTVVATGLAVAVVAVATAACQRPMPDEEGPEGLQAGSETLAERIQGCWALRPGPDGAAADTAERWLEARTLPRVIGLDTARMEREGSDSLYRAWSYRGSRQESRPFSAWRPFAPDSIRVETPGALAGVVLRLAVGEEPLEGTAVVFTDVVQPGGDGGIRKAPVEARRQDCPG